MQALQVKGSHHLPGSRSCKNPYLNEIKDHELAPWTGGLVGSTSLFTRFVEAQLPVLPMRRLPGKPLGPAAVLLATLWAPWGLGSASEEVPCSVKKNT